MFAIVAIGCTGLGLILGSSSAFLFIAWIEKRDEIAKFEIDSQATADHAMMRKVMGRTTSPTPERNPTDGR